MKTLIISPGKKHSPELAALITEYEKRLSGRFDVEWKFIAPDDVPAESAAILKSIGDGDFAVLLDERGKAMSSPEFSKFLEKVSLGGHKRLAFVIGGAFGVGDEVKRRANATISLSNMVFPHQLVRLILVEQIYRASEISRGGKYHHA